MVVPVHAQDKPPKKDSTQLDRLLNTNIFKFAKEAFTRDSTVSEDEEREDILQAKSEAAFKHVDGRIIRFINILQYGFDKTFLDTSSSIQYFGTRILNAIHPNTRDWVIRNNLFFNSNDSLDAYLLADNERYLRTLEFLQDARIIAVPDKRYDDTVDIMVITKDLFSIVGEVGELTTKKFKGKISDANLFGMGQKLQLAVLWEKDRAPVMGYDVRYSKNNIGGSFINGTIGYTSINQAIITQTQSEHGWYVGFDRPLPYASALFAGGLRLDGYESSNNYDKPDSVYYDYKFHTQDIWFGHNINAKDVLRDKTKLNRYFLSARLLNRHFSEIPYQFADSLQFDFNSRRAVLGQFTFFRQQFYKTNYLLNFGNTEDAPYGYKVSLVAGWYKQLYLSRPYMGIDANRYMVTGRGALMHYFVRTGGFLHDGQLEDVGVLLGSSWYSRLLFYRQMKIREHLEFSYTQLIKRRGLKPLQIDNDFGLQDFSVREITGKRRITLKTETSFYLRPKLFGFKFAPFLFGNASLLTPERYEDEKTDLFYGIGGGVRTRNQNLVFGTVELRAVYFPKTLGGTHFKIGINTNLRFRVNTSYVQAPDIIQLNGGGEN